MFVPQPDSAYTQVSFEKAAQAQNKHFDAQGVRYDKDKVDLPVLSIGQLVRVQDKKTDQWQALATVVNARPDGLSYIVDIGGREQLRSRHMLRPEPVSQVENEDDVSERDGPKVGVSPLPTTAPRRSQRLLDRNSEGNRLIPVQPCAEERPKKKSLTSSGYFKSSTGRESVESPSLSWQTRLSTSTLTASAWSTYRGPPLRQGPQSLLPWQSLGSWSPCAATSGHETTGGAERDTTNLLRLSQVGSSQGQSLQAGRNLCHPSQIPHLLLPQPCQGQAGIGPPMVSGQAPPSVLRPFPSMPCQPYLLPLLEDKYRACSSYHSPASHPSTTSRLVCPLSDGFSPLLSLFCKQGLKSFHMDYFFFYCQKA